MNETQLKLDCDDTTGHNRVQTTLRMFNLHIKVSKIIFAFTFDPHQILWIK